MSDYSESVPYALWWKLFPAVLVAVVSLPSWIGGGVDSAAIAVAVAGVFGVISWLFGRLTIRVESGVVSLRQGPVRVSFPLVEVESAGLAKGRWQSEFSLRYGLFGSRHLFLPGVETGIDFQLNDGRRYFVSTARPDELLSALST